jgi:hypothetical protein
VLRVLFMSRYVVRNSYARHTVRSERITITRATCDYCGSVRHTKIGRPYLYRFLVDDDSGSRQSGPIAGGRLFCSRSCAESYTGRSFDETR